MANQAKIAFIGATSMSFGISMFRDIFSSRELSGSTLTLVGRNQQSLARMAKLARLLNTRSGAGLKVEHTTDRRAALAGAGFVINATAVDRLRMWQLDFEVPRKHGIRHTLGENGGPGGLFFTLRTLPLVFDIVREMEELCPKALFINFSNPESRIILALGKYSRISAVGLCHGIFMAQHDVARIMRLKPDEIEVWGAGLNHFQWLLQIRDRTSGEDLYPLLRRNERAHDASFAPLSRRLFRAFGYWPSCSDEHLGELLPYGWEGGETGYDFAGDRRDRDDFRATLERVLSDEAPIPSDWLAPSGERGVAVLSGILHNQKRFVESGVVYNRGAIPNLSADAAVEVPILADAAGVHPVSLGPLPEGLAKLLSMQVAVQQLAVEAAVHASKEIALQALLIDPVVNSSKGAIGLLEELWEANRPYIRKCV
ncbi:MAG TPA: alpha-glucosidase/alpha-galactosidase [Xanthobacteraceae bacterium]|jgi:alpha-galactosidase